MNETRVADPGDAQFGSRLGPEQSDDEVLSFLQSNDVAYDHYPDDQRLCDQVSELLADGNVVGWVQGRMEFGPRALGSRSILGDARDPKMQAVMNLKIKFRESFRPFAPSVLQEKVHEYFALPTRHASPYMLLVGPTCRVGPEADGTGHVQPIESLADNSTVNKSILARLNGIRSPIPAVTHVDYSARVQTVDAVRNPIYHRLLTTFERKTGCAVLINTSFNIRGEPIVCTPQEAYRCFLATNMDALVLGHYVLLKTQQPNAPQHKLDDYLSSFELD